MFLLNQKKNSSNNKNKICFRGRYVHNLTLQALLKINKCGDLQKARGGGMEDLAQQRDKQAPATAGSALVILR